MSDEEERQLSLLAVRKLRECRLERLASQKKRIMAQARLDVLQAKIDTYRSLIDEAKWEEELLKTETHNEEPVAKFVLIPGTNSVGPDPAA